MTKKIKTLTMICLAVLASLLLLLSATLIQDVNKVHADQAVTYGNDPEISPNYTDFNGGSGISSDPYLISNPIHLRNVEKYMDAWFELQNDIDLSGYPEWEAIGGHYKQNAFTGRFDGKNHFIRGLTRTYSIGEQNNRAYYGLFGYLRGAVVKNIQFSYIDINFTGPAVNNGNMRFFIGVLAGYAESSTISNIHLSTSALNYDCDTNGMTYAGSVVGFANLSTISGCYNNLSVTVRRYGAVAGGIAGYAVSSSFTDCTNHARITAKCKGLGGWGVACGIAGEVLNDSAHFTNCRNTGATIAEEYGLFSTATLTTNPISFNTNADYR